MMRTTNRIVFISLTLSTLLFGAEEKKKLSKAEQAWNAELKACITACGPDGSTECVNGCELDCVARAYEETKVLATPACEK